MTAIRFTHLEAGNSRVLGLGAPTLYDHVVNPVVGSLGTGYTSQPGLILSGSTDGTGAVLVPQLIKGTGGSQVNPGIVLGVMHRGRNYNNPASAPTLTLVGGGGSGATATWTLGGGYITPLETDLRNRGLLLEIVDCAMSGNVLNGYDFNASAGASAARAALGSPADTTMAMTSCINEAAASVTPSAYGALLASFIASFAPLVRAIILNKDYGAPPGYPNAAAINALVLQYHAQIDAAVAANPGKVYAGANLYPVMAANANLFGGDGTGNLGTDIHANIAGNLALEPVVAAAYAPIMTTLFGVVPLASSQSYFGPPVILSTPVPDISRAQAIAIIQSGGSVGLGDHVYSRVQDLPSSFV